MMARDLAVDLNTMDVIFPYRFISGTDELQQALSIRLMTPKGTYIRNDVGMDWDWILNGFNLNEGRIAIQDTLKQDDRVINVNDIDFKQDGTTLNIYINVTTTLGIINFSKGVENNAIK